MQLTTDGIVLSDHKIDDDRILTLLTRAQGVLTAFANGANKPRAKLAASTELLCYAQFVLFAYRGRTVVDSADAKNIFFNIRGDIEKLALASYFSELMKELGPQKEEADAQLRLLLNSLHFIENGKRDSRQLKAIYELRLLTLAGYMPQLVACRACACYEAPILFFSPLSGGLVCENCATEADKRMDFPLSPGILAAMRHIIYAPADKLFSFKLSDAGLSALARVSERYLKAQLEKTLPTLEFYSQFTSQS